MMRPRLQLLKELLREDGLLFVAVSDIECAHLVEMLREIFGAANHIGQFVWKSRQNKDNRNKSGFSSDHEYIVAFGNRIKGEARLRSIGPERRMPAAAAHWMRRPPRPAVHRRRRSSRGLRAAPRPSPARHRGISASVHALFPPDDGSAGRGSGLCYNTICIAQTPH